MFRWFPAADPNVWSAERTRRAWTLGLAGAAGFATPFVPKGWFEIWDWVAFGTVLLVALVMGGIHRGS